MTRVEDANESTKTSPNHLARLIALRLGDDVMLKHRAGPEESVWVAPADLLGALTFLRRDPDTDLDLLVDETLVDRGAAGHPCRFELSLRLRSSRLGYRLWLRVPLVDDDEASFPSITRVYPAADLLEREIYDLFGVLPEGHPYLRRLLLYPGFSGHPLRKEYPPDKSQPLVALKRLGPAASVVHKDGTVSASPRQTENP